MNPIQNLSAREQNNQLLAYSTYKMVMDEFSQANAGPDHYLRQRACIHAMICSHLKLNQHSEIKRSATGRPYIEGSHLDISLSHRQAQLFIGAVQRPHRIGVDVELLNENAKLTQDLQRYFLNPLEIIAMTNLSQQKKVPLSWAAITLWSLKEAFFKALDGDFIPDQLCIFQLSDKGQAKARFLPWEPRNGTNTTINLFFEWIESRVYSTCLIYGADESS